MKSIACVSFLALFLLGFLATRPSAAQTGGAYASGAYKFIMEDRLTKYIEFDARADKEGVATGVMIFTDEAKISYQDVDGTGDEGPGDPAPFYMKAELDTLTVEKNRALMDGTIADASIRGYIGMSVQLVVEDNGNNLELPDRVTWRFCQPQPGGWIPSDAEVPGDNGAWLRWWATDAELAYDVGIPSKDLIPGQRRCETLRLWAYSFAEIERGDGDIQVSQ